MPRHLLTAKQIVAARDRDLADGEGLIVRVKQTSCTAVLRFTSPVSHKRRELGLGLVSRDSLQAAGETLVAARVAAEDARRLIRDGLDPIDVRDAKRAEAGAREEAAKAATKSAATTLRRFARNYHDEHVEPLRSTRHAQQWINSIERNVPGKFLDRPNFAFSLWKSAAGSLTTEAPDQCRRSGPSEQDGTPDLAPTGPRADL
jgi:hypothetical protein